MISNRFCILGLPRSGSQYISNLISNNIDCMENLGEPFTESHVNIIENKNNLIYEICSSNNHLTYNKQIEYVLDTLKSGYLTQSLIMKIFLTESIYPFLPIIISEIQKLNFNFLVIKRENIEYHLISWLVAVESNKWWSIDTTHTTPIRITDLNKAKYLYDAILLFDILIQKHDLSAFTIRYEHAVEDISKYLHKSIVTEVDLKKQLPNNPYDMIENADEVKEYLNNLLKTQ